MVSDLIVRAVPIASFATPSARAPSPLRGSLEMMSPEVHFLQSGGRPEGRVSNRHEAISLHIASLREHGEPVPPPTTTGSMTIRVA